MNPYELLMQGLGRFTGVASSPIDPIGTRSYQQLGSQVDSALQRNLPRSFTGAGIQNAPINIIGQVSDLADMPEGSAKEAARNQIQRNLRMAERGLQPPGRPAGQGPGGAFRAPGVGVGGSNTPGMTFNPNTRLPGGGPFQRDYGMTRDAMQAVKKTGSVAKKFKGIKNIGRGGLVELGLMGIDAIGQALNPDFARKRAIQKRYQDATGDPGYALTTEEMQKRLERGVDTDPLAMRARYGGSGDMDAGPGGPSTLSELTAAATLNGIPGIVDVDPKTGKGLPGTFRRGDMDAGDSATYSPSTREYTFNSDTPPPAPILPPPPSNNLPSSPEQSMMDPYAYNLAVYGQGRKLATTQSEMDAVRDLGLAINRKIYDQKFSKAQNINPLMASMFPERVNSTLQGNIKTRGTTLPGSMIEADSGSELATAQVQDTPYQAEFKRGAQEASIADATYMLEQLIGQAEVDAIRRGMGM